MTTKMFGFLSVLVGFGLGFVCAFLIYHYSFVPSITNGECLERVERVYGLESEILHFAKVGREVTAEYRRQKQLKADLAADLQALVDDINAQFGSGTAELVR